MSIAQVVRNIIDQLSDGISQLVLTVVVLAEQNAEIQPGLPEGANAVNDTARTLAKIARQLAGANYKNFPPIAAEINEASDAVDVATGILGKAIQNLVSAADRSQGWSGLVEACRIMAGKTIRLLQIVYGADLQRLMFVADNLMNLLGAVDPNDLKTNPVKFRDNAQTAATQVNQLAQYLKQRADDTESPLVKAQIASDAQKLAARAQEMINQINQCLTNPNDAEKARACKELMDQVRKEVASAKQFAQENAPEAPQVNLPPGLEAHHRHHDEPQGHGHHGHPGHHGHHDAPYEPSPAQSSADADNVAQIANALKAVSALGDDAAVQANAKELKAVVQKLKNDLPSASSHLPPAQQKRIQDALEKIVDSADQEIEATQHGRGHPGQATKIANAAANIDKAAKDIKDLLADRDPGIDFTVNYNSDDEYQNSDYEDEPQTFHFDLDNARGVEKASLPPPDSKSVLANQIARLKNNAGAIQDKASRGDAVGLAMNAGKAEKDLADLAEPIHKGDQFAPAQKPAVVAAFNRVEQALPHQLVAAKRAVEHPTPENKKALQDETQKLQSALDALEEVSKPTLADEIHKTKAALDDLVAAHARGDKNLIADNLAPKAAALHPKVAHQAEYVAQETNSMPTKRAIEAPLASFKKNMPDIVENAKRGHVDPHQIKQVQRDLDDVLQATNGDAVGAIKKLNLLSDDLGNSANERNVPVVQDIADMIVPLADQAEALANEASARSTDPVQKERIQNVAREIPHATKNVLLASKQVLDHPEDPNAKAALKERQKELKDLSDSLVDALQGNMPVPPSKKALDESAATLDRLKPRLDDDNGKLRANNNDLPAKKAVIKDAALIADTIKNISNTVAPPTDPNAQAMLKTETVRARIRDLTQAVEDNNQDKYQVHLRKIEKDLPLAIDAIKNAPTDSPEAAMAVADACADLQAYTPHVAKLGREALSSPHDLSKKNNFLDAAKNLDRVLLRATHKAVPEPDEREIVDAGTALRKKIAAIRAARAASGQSAQPPQRAQDEIEWKNIKVRLRKAADHKNQWSPQSDGPSQELKDIWSRMEQKRSQGADPNELHALEDGLIKKTEELADVTHAKRVSPILEAETLLDDIVVAAMVNQPSRIKPQLSELNNKLKGIKAQNEGTPCAETATELAVPVKEVVIKAIAVLSNPGDEVKTKELQESVDKAKVVTFQLKKEIDNQGLHRTAELELQKTKAALAHVHELNRNPANRQAVVNAIAAAKEQAKVASEETYKLAANNRTQPAKRAELIAVTRALDEAINKLAPAEEPQVAQTSLVSDHAVDRVMSAIENDVADDLISAAASTKAAADVVTTYGNQISPSEVNKLADDLSKQTQRTADVSRDYAKHIGSQAVGPTIKPQHSPASTPQVVQSIKSTPYRATPTPSLPSVVQEINTLANPKPVNLPPPVRKAQKPAPHSFEDVVDNVAEDISAKAAEVDCLVAGDIGVHLANLAKHARTGERQNMLQEARAAALKIAELCKLLRETANKTQGRTHQEKVIQDRLIRAAQALSNYGTQLKILTSVKAASVAQDKDTDESLNSIVRGIGAQVGEGLTSLDIAERTILKTKK